jgi:hypothetical protein
MDSEFEQRLRRLPVKPVPAAWRAEILTAVATDMNRRQAGREFTFSATVALRLRRIFWPHPAAWAGLAAAWVLIFVLNFSPRDAAPVVAETFAPPSPEVLAQLRQQQKILAELTGARERGGAELPKTFAPQPRSTRKISAV